MKYIFAQFERYVSRCDVVTHHFLHLMRSSGVRSVILRLSRCFASLTLIMHPFLSLPKSLKVSSTLSVDVSIS
jgi:hypothetical protein